MSSTVTADGRLVVVDSRNSMLKTFSNYDSTPTGRAADFQVGQNASSISTAGSAVVLVNGPNLRVFNPWPATAGTLAPAVSIASRFGCAADALGDASSAHMTPLGRLIVTDRTNHRVLIWNSIPASGELGRADVVLGQPSMDTCLQNGGGAPSAGSLAFPASVWSDDTKLVVSDRGNNRVLIWDTFPGNSRRADHVIGQGNFGDVAPNAGGAPGAHTLDEPRSVDVNEAGQLAVADAGNSRVLIWNQIPVRDGQAADQVIGQPGFDQSGLGDPSARNMFLPYSARFHKRNLIVTQPEWNRVMIWRALD